MRKLASLILLLVAGCGPAAGSGHVARDVVACYVNDEAFQRRVDREKAGVSVPLDELGDDAHESRVVFIHEGDLVRVVEPVPGGYKIAVESGEAKNAIGRITSRSMRDDFLPR